MSHFWWWAMMMSYFFIWQCFQAHLHPTSNSSPYEWQYSIIHYFDASNCFFFPGYLFPGITPTQRMKKTLTMVENDRQLEAAFLRHHKMLAWTGFQHHQEASPNLIVLSQTGEFTINSMVAKFVGLGGKEGCEKGLFQKNYSLTWLYVFQSTIKSNFTLSLSLPPKFTQAHLGRWDNFRILLPKNWIWSLW